MYKILKPIIIIILILILACGVNKAEINPYSYLRADNAVPSNPALNITSVDIDENKVLRPGSIEDIAFALKPFSSGSGIIPSNFGVELSIRNFNCIPLSSYINNWFARTLCNTRFSLASGKVNGSYSFGLGLRINLYDESDPLLDTIYIGNVTRTLLKMAQTYGAVNDEFMKYLINDCKLDSTESKKIINDLSNAYVNNKIQSSKYNEQYGDKYTEYVKKYKEYNNNSIPIDSLVNVNKDELSEVRKLELDSMWNKNSAEIGIAMLANSADSLFKNLESMKYRGWLAGGFRLGKKGQIVSSAMASIAKGPTGKFDMRDAIFGARLYYGGNSLKVFGEASAKFKSYEKPQHNAMLGGEFRVYNSRIWIDMSVGYKIVAGSNMTFTQAINIKYGL